MRRPLRWLRSRRWRRGRWRGAAGRGRRYREEDLARIAVAILNRAGYGVAETAGSRSIIRRGWRCGSPHSSKRIVIRSIGNCGGHSSGRAMGSFLHPTCETMWRGDRGEKNSLRVSHDALTGRTNAGQAHGMLERAAREVRGRCSGLRLRFCSKARSWCMLNRASPCRDRHRRQRSRCNLSPRAMLPQPAMGQARRHRPTPLPRRRDRRRRRRPP